MKTGKMVRLLRVFASTALFASIPAFGQYAAPPLTGLVSWWRGEGNANDSASSNTGSALNGAGYSGGAVGSGFLFDGVDDHIRIPDSPGLRLTTGFTLAAWVNPSSRGSYDEILSKWGAVFPVNHNGYTFSIHPDGRSYVAVSADGSDAGANVFTTSTIPLNTWTHLAGSYDGSTLRIYINGILNNETPYSGGVFPTLDDLSIGGVVGGTDVGGGISFFDGRIDEVMIYNRALSGSEVLTLVPEPSALAILALGLAGMVAKSKGRRKITSN
ncbi:MAG TPA: LamG domain-containing protein [Verrucomicrobiae bacterium]|nr:LamG domain-containing protein [Verrucomicrobiae bacterium]